MRRRLILAGLVAGGLAGVAGYRLWPDEGVWNPCLAGPLPERLARHEVLQAAWAGIDPRRVWDCHVHLAGVGDSDSGVWINPQMDSPRHPIQYVKKQFYLNAGCTEEGKVDESYLARLLRLLDDHPRGVRLMLLAFDHHYNETGERVLPLTAFYAPNDFVRDLARRYPDRFEWIASIHPYRADAVPALERAVKEGARAVKWLPPAMGMDPASPRCDAFYAALARLDLPLLTHAGEEVAVHSAEFQALGNPLRLRRALDRGVRVIVAHCASYGDDVDLDRGPNGPRVASFELFARMMDEPSYEKLLFGELSAVTQVNRLGRPLETLLTRDDWHGRLVNGSDYPLPAVMPLFSLKRLVERGYLGIPEAGVISEIRRYNPLLFDFVLKRHLRHRRLPPRVFETRRVFAAQARRARTGKLAEKQYVLRG
jgi:mannonate dehydratase